MLLLVIVVLLLYIINDFECVERPNSQPSGASFVFL